MKKPSLPTLPTLTAENHAAARRAAQWPPPIHAIPRNHGRGRAEVPSLVLEVARALNSLGEEVVYFYRWKGAQFVSTPQGVTARHLLPAAPEHPDMSSLLRALDA